MKEIETKIKDLSIKIDPHVYCDYCGIKGEKVVSKPDGGDSRDICFDCILEIYNIARKEIL